MYIVYKDKRIKSLPYKFVVGQNLLKYQPRKKSPWIEKVG